MKFIDEARIKVTAGNGGGGLVGWRREKYVPLGGPDGGDGGDGGAVIFSADPGLNNLFDFAINPLIRAKDGEDGGSNQKNGHAGADCIKPIPVGTQIFFQGNLVADLSIPGARWVAAKGGRGGKGNAFFKSATHQAPAYAQKGQPGENFEFQLVLKSVADVGLVGLPNVGKSTLIRAVSQARPEVAAYPFTTLRPHLGVVTTAANQRYVVADIPGIIEGAHQGKGLGIQFLKHIERTRVIAQLIDITTSRDGNFSQEAIENSLSEEQILEAVIKQFELIDAELAQFSEELKERPRIIVFTKADFEIAQRAFTLSLPYFAQRKFNTLLVSSISSQGLEDLKTKVFNFINENR